MDVNARLKRHLERQAAEKHGELEKRRMEDEARKKQEEQKREMLMKKCSMAEKYKAYLEGKIPRILPGGFEGGVNTTAVEGSKPSVLRFHITQTNPDMISTTSCIALWGVPTDSFIEICEKEDNELGFPSFWAKLIIGGKEVRKYEMNEVNPYTTQLDYIFKEYMDALYPGA